MCKIRRRLKETIEEAQRGIITAIAPAAGGDQGVIVGPHGAQMVADRAVAPLFCRQGADPPAGEHILGHEPFDRPPCFVGFSNPRPERLAWVGGDDGGRSPPGLQGQGIDASLRQPKALIESCAQLLSLSPQPLGPLRLPSSLIEVRERGLGQVRIALYLHKRNRWYREAAVIIDNGIPRILPSLIGQPLVRSALVLEIAIAVAISVRRHPCQGLFDRRSELMKEIQIASPGGVPAEQDQKEERRINGAIIGSLWDLMQPSHLTDAELMQDLARLLVPPGINRASLIACQETQRVLRD